MLGELHSYKFNKIKIFPTVMQDSNKNEFYSCLNELDNILNNLMTTNYYFEFFVTYIPSLRDEAHDSELLRIDKIQPILDILIDNMIIQLDKIFEIQPQLGSSLKQNNQLKILQVIKNSWSLIKENKDKINDWRNQFVAHSSEQSKNYISYHKFDPDYLVTFQRIISTSRYVVTYLWAILRNILEDFMEATGTKYEEMKEIERVDKIEFLSKAINNEKNFFEQINLELEQNGFKPVIFCGYETWPMKTVSK